MKDDHPINMWMVQPDQHFDYIARKGRQIGIAVDDHWAGGGPVDAALKTTYFDRGSGTVDIVVKTSGGEARRSRRV